MLKTTTRARTITRCGLIKKDDLAKPNVLSTFAESHHLIHSIDIFASGTTNLNELKEAFNHVKINIIPETTIEHLFLQLEPYFEKDYLVYGKALGAQAIRDFCNICFLGDYCVFSLNKDTRTQLGEFPQGYVNKIFNRFDVIIPLSGNENGKRKLILNGLKPILAVSSSFAFLLEKENNFEVLQTATIQHLQTELSSFTNKFPNIHSISSDSKQNGMTANELHLWTAFNAINIPFQPNLTTKVNQINALSAKGIFPPSLLRIVFDKLSNKMGTTQESASILVRGFTDSAWSWGRIENSKGSKITFPHPHCRSAIGSGENSSTTFLSATESGDALIFFTCLEADAADNYS